MNRSLTPGLCRDPYLCWKKPETDELLEQTLIEAPPARPHVIRLVTHRDRCRGCGRRVASTHPLQVSTAGGAAGSHLGPRALALAAPSTRGSA